MGIFGGKDKDQDAQLQQFQKDIANCWAWIQAHEKNMAILIKNNNAFIEKNKNQANLNKQFTASINALVEKDKLHDQKDSEHDALLQGLKQLTQTVEATQSSEG